VRQSNWSRENSIFPSKCSSRLPRSRSCYRGGNVRFDGRLPKQSWHGSNNGPPLLAKVVGSNPVTRLRVHRILAGILAWTIGGVGVAYLTSLPGTAQPAVPSTVIPMELFRNRPAIRVAPPRSPLTSNSARRRSPRRRRRSSTWSESSPSFVVVSGASSASRFGTISS
jgi:hypothetical protein